CKFSTKSHGLNAATRSCSTPRIFASPRACCSASAGSPCAEPLAQKLHQAVLRGISAPNGAAECGGSKSPSVRNTGELLSLAPEGASTPQWNRSAFAVENFEKTTRKANRKSLDLPPIGSLSHSPAVHSDQFSTGCIHDDA